MIRIEPHKNTRHWAVWHNDKLIAVVCYKKGAQAIKQILTQALSRRQPVSPMKARKASARIKTHRRRP
jgi:hypothetical protein